MDNKCWENIGCCEGWVGFSSTSNQFKKQKCRRKAKKTW